MKPVTARDQRKGISKVKFGNVTISSSKPKAELVKINVDLSTEALKRVAKRLERPGVAIRAKKEVPLYSVSDDGHGFFIRRLNGISSRGRFVNGAFEEVID